MTDTATHDRPVAVYGASGATGRLVVDELLARGFRVVAAGRSADRLDALRERHPQLEVWVAAVDESDRLQELCGRSVALVNCAGPFVDTVTPLARAAMAAGVPYLDIAAEQPAVSRAFELAQEATDAGTAVLPGVAFFGALGDLLATIAAGDWEEVDSVVVAAALDGWRPTEGTLRTGAAYTEPHRWVREGRFEPYDEAWEGTWSFPAPVGDQSVGRLCLAETILISQHLRAPSIGAVLSSRALAELGDSKTRTRERGETGAGQQFLVEAVVRRGGATRRAHAGGYDIYAVTAPIVVSALEEVLRTPPPPGVWPVAAVVDPARTLKAAGLLVTPGDDA